MTLTFDPVTLIVRFLSQEAFNMIDQNRDGYIDKDDLLDMMTSLGKDPSNEHLDKMITEAPGPINFTMFLTLFGEKLNGTDPEDVIRNAFACFDERNSGMSFATLLLASMNGTQVCHSQRFCLLR